MFQENTHAVNENIEPSSNFVDAIQETQEEEEPKIRKPRIKKTDTDPSKITQEKTLKSAFVKKDCSFQMGMVGRNDVYVTINLKEGQTITDKAILKALAATGSYVDYHYE